MIPIRPSGVIFMKGSKMGLDIAFNREEALAAGLELVTEARDPDGVKLWPDDKEMQDFCNEVVTYVKVPGTEMLTEDNGIDKIVVRANKWGMVYGPMTEWLAANNIGWDEF
jgi:hypothetical protein